MIEIYEPSYTKMGFHTDQSQDLEEDSFIVLCSFYEKDLETEYRKLVVENKETKETQTILLEHGSAVLFSAQANFRHLHKIILDNQKAKHRWLGVTFRLSKTFVQVTNSGQVLLLPKGNPLRLANDVERKQQLMESIGAKQHNRSSL